MSDTPRTDAIITGNCTPSTDEYEDLAILTRQLERELRAKTERLREMSEQIDEMSDGWP